MRRLDLLCNFLALLRARCDVFADQADAHGVTKLLSVFRLFIKEAIRSTDKVSDTRLRKKLFNGGSFVILVDES